MSILVSGSLVYDYIMDFPDSFKNHILPEQIHILNVCFVVDRLERSWGGTAGNIAYTMKLLGADPLVVSAVGSDGGGYVDYLKKNGLNTDFIKQDEKRSTASAHITTDNEDNQITAFFNGPLDLAEEYNLAAIASPLSVALISPTSKSMMIKHLRDCRERGLPAVFDPGQQITAFTTPELQMMVSQAEFVIGNDYEMKLLQDRTGWDAKKIISETKTLITTLGEQGAIIATPAGEQINVKSCPPKSCDDPTGAGDAFRAGFFVGFERGYNFKTCGQLGAVAASYAIETYGTQTHRFTLPEFSERYEKNYGEKIILV